MGDDRCCECNDFGTEFYPTDELLEEIRIEKEKFFKGLNNE